MREVVVIIRCDGCGEHLAEEGVVELRATVGGVDYESDMCGECAQISIGNMREVRRRYRGKGAPGQKYPCTECEKSFSKKNGLSRHMNQTHGALNKDAL